jgi:hypothetical protein
MISYLSKLVIVLFLFLAGLSPALANDILLNGDFSDGKTHWHGDGDAPDLGGKLVITLKPDRWTGVYQTFSAESTALKLKVTYELSDDCSLGAKKSPDDIVSPLTASALQEATGLQNGIFNITLDPYYSWVAVFVSGGSLIEEQPAHVQLDKGNPHNLEMTVSPWMGKFDDVNLCLVFPPGRGTVTLTKVELVPPTIPQH